MFQRRAPQRMTTGLLACLALLTASGPFATDLYLPGMPQVAQDLNTSSSMAQLTLSAFMMGMALGQLFVGVISDALGRSKPIRLGAIIALVGSLLCVVAPNVEVLILARLIHGLGSGACLVVARAMVPDIAKGKETARAFTVLMMIQGLAPVIAPIVGGLLADPIGWRGIFAVLSAIVFFQLIMAFFLPETLAPENRGVFKLSALGKTFGSVLSKGTFAWYTVAFAFGFGGFFAYISASSFVVQENWGFSPGMYSVIFAVNASALILFGWINNRMLHKYSEFQIALGSISIMSLAAAGTTVLALTEVPAWVHLVVLFFGVAPLPMIMGNLTSIAIKQVPKTAGSAAAVMGFFQFVLAAVVSPIVGLGSNESFMMGLCMLGGYLIAVIALLIARRLETADTATAAQK